MQIRMLIMACLCGGSVWAAKVDFAAGPVPRSDRAILRVPYQIGVREVDGRVFKTESTFKPVRELQLELVPGTHNLLLQFYDPFGEDAGLSPAHLRSENMLVAFDAEAGRVYQARFKTPEQALGDEPRRFKIWVENESRIAISRRPDEQPESQWVKSKDKDSSLGSVLRLFNDRADGASATAQGVQHVNLAPPEQSFPDAPLAPTTRATVAAPVRDVPQISNLDLLKLWWSKATIEERRVFMSWIVGQRN